MFPQGEGTTCTLHAHHDDALKLPLQQSSCVRAGAVSSIHCYRTCLKSLSPEPGLSLFATMEKMRLQIHEAFQQYKRDNSGACHLGLERYLEVAVICLYDHNVKHDFAKRIRELSERLDELAFDDILDRATERDVDAILHLSLRYVSCLSLVPTTVLHASKVPRRERDTRALPEHRGRALVHRLPDRRRLQT